MSTILLLLFVNFLLKIFKFTNLYCTIINSKGAPMKILRELRKQKSKTQAQMGAMLGISQQAYATYENGVANPPVDILNKMAEYFGVSVDYLLGRDTIPAYRNTYPLEPYIKLPVFGEIRAGTPINMEQGETGEWEYADASYGDGQHFMLRVNGNSMSPTIPDGSMAIIRVQNYAEPKQVVAFAMDGDYATLKRYYPQSDGSILLRGDNPEADSYLITKDQIQNGDAHILGIVRSYKVNL